jgi:hypothetical protein
MKIVQTDGDEVAQHGTLELLILESSNRHRNLAHCVKFERAGAGQRKKPPEGGFSFQS